MIKKSIIVILIIVLVGIGVFSLIQLFPPTSGTNGNTPVSDDERNTNSNNEDENNNEEDNEEEKEDSSITERVTDIISDVIQNATDYFANKESNVVAIGDSLTEGVGDETNNGGYIGIIDEIVNDKKHVATFENFGKRGNRSDQMLERMDYPDINEALEDADIILITIGANDIMKIVRENITDLKIEEFKEERNHYEERLRVIFDEMVERNGDAEIYLLGFYNPFKQYFHIKELDTIVDEWNKTGEDLSREYDQITFIPTKDLFDEGEEEEELLSDDNFHPNFDGYQKMAKRVLEYVAGAH